MNDDILKKLQAMDPEHRKVALEQEHEEHLQRQQDAPDFSQKHWNKGGNIREQLGQARVDAANKGTEP